LPFAKAGVDIHVSSSFSSQSVGDFSYMVCITYYLQSAEQEQCHGLSVNAASNFVNGKMVICALNDSNTILILLLLIPLVALTSLSTYSFLASTCALLKQHSPSLFTVLFRQQYGNDKSR
jgi:hypothetical protein